MSSTSWLWGSISTKAGQQPASPASARTSAHIRPPPSRTAPARRCRACGWLLPPRPSSTASPRALPPPPPPVDRRVASAGAAPPAEMPASPSSSSSRARTVTRSAKSSWVSRVSVRTSSLSTPLAALLLRGGAGRVGCGRAQQGRAGAGKGPLGHSLQRSPAGLAGLRPRLFLALLLSALLQAVRAHTEQPQGCCGRHCKHPHIGAEVGAVVAVTAAAAVVTAAAAPIAATAGPTATCGLCPSWARLAGLQASPPARARSGRAAAGPQCAWD